MRVLIVEDEPRIAADIRQGLEMAGYVADVVADGEAAWFRAETETYDAMVLDLGLPRLDGLGVLRRLRAAAPEGVTITDHHRDYAVLAVQGPKSDEVLDAIGLPTGHDYMSFVEAPLEGADVVVGVGGYVCTPVYLAARKRRIPVVIHEANARAGLANKVGARFAARVAFARPFRR